MCENCAVLQAKLTAARKGGNRAVAAANKYRRQLERARVALCKAGDDIEKVLDRIDTLTNELEATTRREEHPDE